MCADKCCSAGSPNAGAAGGRLAGASLAAALDLNWTPLLFAAVLSSCLTCIIAKNLFRFLFSHCLRRITHQTCHQCCWHLYSSLPKTAFMVLIITFLPCTQPFCIIFFKCSCSNIVCLSQISFISTVDRRDLDSCAEVCCWHPTMTRECMYCSG